MIRLAVLLALLAACGRWRFDEIARDDGALDALDAHDEDGDGMPDVIDKCPQIAGDNADADGDGVGDLCDPNPANPTERFTLFASMQPGHVPFADTFGWVQHEDSLFGSVSQNSPTTNALGILRSVATTRIDFRFTILAINGTAIDQHQVACGIDRPQPYYFAELNDNGPTVHDVGLFSFDATNGYVALGTTDIAGLHTGQGLLRIDADASMHRWYVLAGWTGETYTTSGITASYDGGSEFNFVVNNIDIELESVTIVETQ